MRPPPNLFFAAIILALTAGGNARADNLGGSAVPVPKSLRKPLTPDEIKNPDITKPAEQAVECRSDADRVNDGQIMQNGRLAYRSKKCLPQSDAFKSASEAASYLAIYQTYMSQYAETMQDDDKRREIQASVKACLEGSPDCDDTIGDDDHVKRARAMKQHLFAALVQYNFGKEVRAQMLENATRAENMKTMDVSPQELRDRKWRPRTVITTADNRLHHQAVRDKTFRLDPSQIQMFEPEKLSDQERAQLGAEFNNFYGQFVKEYSSSTGQRGPKSRWHYVAAKSAAVGSGGATAVIQPSGRNDDPEVGNAAIDRGRLARDIRSQESGNVSEIVASFQDHFKDVVKNNKQDVEYTDQTTGKKETKSIDSMKAAVQAAGFGLPNSELARIGTKGGPEDARHVAQAVVTQINYAITDQERQITKEGSSERFPSSADPRAKTKIDPSVKIDIAQFDKFLDEIWPGGEKDKPSATN